MQDLLQKSPNRVGSFASINKVFKRLENSTIKTPAKKLMSHTTRGARENTKAALPFDSLEAASMQKRSFYD